MKNCIPVRYICCDGLCPISIIYHTKDVFQCSIFLRLMREREVLIGGSECVRMCVSGH